MATTKNFNRQPQDQSLFFCDKWLWSTPLVDVIRIVFVLPLPPPSRTFLSLSPSLSVLHRPIAWRREQLERLRKMVEENEDEIVAAIDKDLRRRGLMFSLFIHRMIGSGDITVLCLSRR